MSINIDDLSIDELRVQLKKKNEEYSELQNNYNDFVHSSKELEIALESHIQEEQTKSEDLLKKVQQLENKNNEYSRQFALTNKTIVKLQSDNEDLKNKYAANLALKNTLELTQDDLMNKIRILESTISDLETNNENNEELNVFLSSDVEILNEKLKNLQEEYREFVLDSMMLKHENDTLKLTLEKEKTDKHNDPKKKKLTIDTTLNPYEYKDEKSQALSPVKPIKGCAASLMDEKVKKCCDCTVNDCKIQ
eukprot:TRINITY_DN70587_c0_g1_i1.p1 TRINITY_DN70587_c0_g1~~TRINITY_DN70587_c0_g1_i1.p1  ORF type:complete len:250 (-),score=19.72 TRINITY_DN70587_c0_g1_i1:69-818(-)